MASSSSPGVYVSETDRSQSVASPSTSIGVIVGRALQGPVMERTLITSEKQLISTFGKPDASLDFAIHSALAFLTYGDQLYFMRVSPESKYGAAYVTFDGNYNGSVSVVGGIDDPETAEMPADALFMITAANQGTWADDVFVQVYPNTDAMDNTFYVDVYVSGNGKAVESHLVSLDMQKNGYGTQLNIAQYINKRSNYIRIYQNEANSTFAANSSKRFINTVDTGGDAKYVGIRLTGGDNGRAPTTGEIMLAWEEFASAEKVNINILINAGYTDPNIQTKMTEICEDRMDCMAVLDVPQDEQGMQNAIAWRRNELMLDSTYAALYSPDLLISDEYNDMRLYVPPSGYVAAAYARTDKEYETWFAPAGWFRGDLNVRGVYVQYDRPQRDALFQSQINVIRMIEGNGVKIWGADTLQIKQSALSNINVRRLMLYIEKSLSNAALYSVFDPNDPILWSFLDDLCRTFLQGVQRGEGVYWFEVICNETNNTPDTIANGDVILDIYLDPVLPAKRIHLNCTVNKTGSRVTAVNN